VRSGVVAPAGPVIGHDHARAGRADMLKAVDAHPRPPAHHHSIQSVTAESARAAPRHHTSTAPAAVPDAPAANVGTVRQDTRRSFSVTPRPQAEETDLLISRLCGPGTRVFGSSGTHGWGRVEVRNTPVRQEDPLTRTDGGASPATGPSALS
jgi:hypothetical protein